MLDSALHVHRDVGPAMFESVCERVLAHTLRRRGVEVRTQQLVSIAYDELWLEDAFRIGLLVESSVVVEIKSTDRLAAVHAKQVVTYLRVMDLRVGLLLNLGADLLRDGVRRVVNDFAPSAASRLRVNRPPLPGPRR